MAVAAEIVFGLGDLVTDALGADAVLDVQTVTSLSSGASRQSLRFEARRPGAPAKRYVLQRQVAGLAASTETGALVKATAPLETTASSETTETGIDMAGQAALLRAAGDAGVPVPPVVAAGVRDDVPYLLTEWLPGEALPHRLLRDVDLRPGVERLQADCATALARLHRLSPTAVTLPDQDHLARYRSRLDQMREPRPVLELGYRWLDLHRPAGSPHRVVHGDFRLGNLLVDRTGLRAILDWELAHLGDPYSDLAWPTIRAWRFDRYRPAGTFPETEQWLEAYEEAAGVGVDREVFKWWQVAGTWTWAVMSGMQARRHLDSDVPSLEHAAIGRRVCESEHDLLELLP